MKTNSLTYIIIAILMTLSLSSCTVDEDFSDLENSSQPASKKRTALDETTENKEEIIFKVKSNNDASSKDEQNNLTKFKITAYEDEFNYYNGRTDEVTTSDNGLSWKSDYNRYWPANRSSNWKGLTFYAYSEGKSKNSPSEGNCGIRNLDCSYRIPIIKNFKVNEEVGEQSNLMYAVATEAGNPNQNREVNLSFKNALSTVNFTAVNNNPNISNIEILSIELGGVKGEGHFQFPDYAAIANKPVIFESDCQGKWIIPEDIPSQSYKLDNINLNLGSAGTSNIGIVPQEMHLIPQKTEEITDLSSSERGFIKVTVKMTSKGSASPKPTKDLIFPITIDWQEGNTYTYDINWTSSFTIISCCESNN